MITEIDFERQWKAIGAAVLAVTERVGASGRYILGKEVERFETSLAAFWGARYAVGVGNGMDALEIGLRCLGLRPGEKVLTTPFSAFATTLAILRAGGVPVFVDVDDNGNIDLDQSREVLSRDPSIRFLLPVHLYGNPCDLEKLANLKRDFDLRIVEDCAQAIGAQHGGRAVGSVGQIAGTSFYPTKNLGALGDGGALLTDDATLAEKAKALRNYGQSAHYVHSELGLNSRLDELQAGILGDALLPNLPTWTARRRDIAARYQDRIRHPNISVLPVAAESGSVWHLFPVLVAGKRDALREYLHECKILTGVHYPRIIPEQSALKELMPDHPAVSLEKARYFAASELSLPIHPFLTDAEVDSVIQSCNGWRS
jgi:dTDP-3-amino-3,4,6-trideoxy-alpha-D-glucose transaminase